MLMLMDSSFFFTVFVAGIGFLTLFGTIGFFKLTSALFFMVLRRFRFHQDLASSLSSPPSRSPPSSSSPPSIKWTHDVFPSFHGEDVRRKFLSHLQKEFRVKGIIPFNDNDIKRGESIGPELVKAIRKSKIAVILLSKNYASSKWCLDELLEIIKCKNELGQIVFAVFYEVDPSHVKKLTGEFGAVFKKTCAGKTKEDIDRWKQAFAEVATIAGYDSRIWDNEVVMIEKIVTEISNRLISSTPSKDMESLIGMQAHVEKMKSLLCLGSDEVRTIGICGLPGIGKTTIARFLHKQVSDAFQMNVFMPFKPSYARSTYSDDYDEKLHLEQEFLSLLTNQGNIKIPHCGAAQNFVMNKKLLVIFDGVEQLKHLLAMPEARHFGPGSRIIITTKDLKLLKALKIDHIYQVDLPPCDAALQIFCMKAFGQTSPKDGYKKLAWEVINLAGRLPLGLRIMGSHFRGILSEQEWKAELPRLRFCLDGEIKSILKFSYDALEKENRDLFLCIACFFVDEGLYDCTYEDLLKHRFSNVRQGLEVLVQRSLVTHQDHYSMHPLLVQLGREIVREEFPSKPGKRPFLVGAMEICDLLTDNNTESGSVIGINLNFSVMEQDQEISARGFERMTNLQFLRFHCDIPPKLPQGLEYLPPKLRLLHWDNYPLKRLPCNFNPKFLVKIQMEHSKLEKLWEGIQPLRNLKQMHLNFSQNLKELPDLSTATNLLELSLHHCKSLLNLPSSIGNAKNLGTLFIWGCSSLVKLPSSIGNLINLQEINLNECSSLVKLPSSIGDLINLRDINLCKCSSLVELPFSIGKLTNLRDINLCECSSLVELPISIGKLTNLRKLDLKKCSSLVELPSSIGNLKRQDSLHIDDCSSLVELPSSIGNFIHFKRLCLSGLSSLVGLPSSIGNLTNLQELKLEECSNLKEIPTTIGNIINLERIVLLGCSSLVKLPSSIGDLTNLHSLYFGRCSNLVELPSSIGNLTNLKCLNCKGCSNLVGIPSSIENLTNLETLFLNDCSSLVEFPFSKLKRFDVTGCSQLRNFPQMSTNIRRLDLCGTLIKEVPLSIKSWSKLKDFSITYCKDLEEFPHVLDIITELELNDKEMEEIPPWVGGITRLNQLVLNNCKKLVSLPQLPGTMYFLVAKNCDSLERLACSFPNPTISLKFMYCFKLDEEARDIIIRTYSPAGDATILPGREVHAFFTYRSTSGDTLRVKLNERCFPTSLKFKVCILLVSKGDKEAGGEEYMRVSTYVRDEQSGHVHNYLNDLGPLLKEHLYTFEVRVPNVDSSELLFEFRKDNAKWEIAECGVREL